MPAMHDHEGASEPEQDQGEQDPGSDARVAPVKAGSVNGTGGAGATMSTRRARGQVPPSG
jgi:hypothetical protein